MKIRTVASSLGVNIIPHWFTTFARAEVVPHEVLSLDGTREIIFDPLN